MVAFYQLGIQFYTWAIHVASLWNPKAKKWVHGRRGLVEKIETLCNPSEEKIWMHCPSLGEFEQGRPLLESLRASYPHVTIILTFYSPSGYEIRKNYLGADHIFYLPADTRRNARRLVRAFNPMLTIFVKYDFWLHYLEELKKHPSTTILISGIFRSKQHFFGLLPHIGRRMLNSFDHFFVQDEQSVVLLKKAGYKNVTKSGDTRLDRVAALSKQAEPMKRAAAFTSGSFAIVAGSTWPADEKILLPLVNDPSYQVKWIIAPHEISEAHLQQIEKQLTRTTVRCSAATESTLAEADVLLIDNIGLLSRLYQYADFAYIGGGFGKSIHNILEPAAWGTPMIFGPKYHKFAEAFTLLKSGGAEMVTNKAELAEVFARWYKDETDLKRASAEAAKFISKGVGATEIIAKWIDQKLKSATN